MTSSARHPISSTVSPTLFLLLLSIISSSAHILSKRSTQDPQQELDLPECASDSSCGYVQLNGRGVNSQQTCRCPGRASCPLTWDPFDGQTVVHGNDQYKYCGAAPALEVCRKNQLAYTTKLDMSMMTMKTLVSEYQLHCICRGNWMLTRNSSDFLEVDDEVSQLVTAYTCSPPARCAIGSPCMGVTESREASFVTRMCRCPRGSTCPRDLRLATRVQTRNGAYFTMECQ